MFVTDILHFFAELIRDQKCCIIQNPKCSVQPYQSVIKLERLLKSRIVTFNLNPLQKLFQRFNVILYVDHPAANDWDCWKLHEKKIVNHNQLVLVLFHFVILCNFQEKEKTLHHRLCNMYSNQLVTKKLTLKRVRFLLKRFRFISTFLILLLLLCVANGARSSVVTFKKSFHYFSATTTLKNWNDFKKTETTF